MLHEVFLFMFMIKQSVSVYSMIFHLNQASDTLVSDRNGALSYLERQLYSAMMLINTIQSNRDETSFYM